MSARHHTRFLCIRLDRPSTHHHHLLPPLSMIPDAQHEIEAIIALAPSTPSIMAWILPMSPSLMAQILKMLTLPPVSPIAFYFTSWPLTLHLVFPPQPSTFTPYTLPSVLDPSLPYTPSSSSQNSSAPVSHPPSSYSLSC